MRALVDQMELEKKERAIKELNTKLIKMQDSLKQYTLPITSSREKRTSSELVQVVTNKPLVCAPPRSCLRIVHLSMFAPRLLYVRILHGHFNGFAFRLTCSDLPPSWL